MLVQKLAHVTTNPRTLVWIRVGQRHMVYSVACRFLGLADKWVAGQIFGKWTMKIWMFQWPCVIVRPELRDSLHFPVCDVHSFTSKISSRHSLHSFCLSFLFEAIKKKKKTLAGTNYRENLLKSSIPYFQLVWYLEMAEAKKKCLGWLVIEETLARQQWNN